jgi:diguanylate cyclase (GGDEF)-like protein
MHKNAYYCISRPANSAPNTEYSGVLIMPLFLLSIHRLLKPSGAARLAGLPAWFLKGWWMLGLLTLLWANAALAQETVVLQPRAEGVWLQGRVAVLEDREGHLTLEDIRQSTPGQSWHVPPGPLRLHGPSAWWLRIQMTTGTRDDQWVLTFPTTAIRDIAFHGPFASDGLNWGSGAQTGLIRPYASRPLGMERITYPFHLPFAGDYTLYVRVQNTIAQNITPAIWEIGDYVKNRQHKKLFDGVIYGVLLALLIYNLTLAGVFRDAAYLHYVLTCLTALLTIATFNGHTAHYLWPGSPWWIEHSYVIWPALWLASSAGFARAFLSTRVVGRAADGPVLAMAGVALASAAIGAAGHTALSQQLNETLALVGIAGITAIGLWIWRRGQPSAGWYLLAKLTLFASVIGVVAVARGWWHAPVVLSYGLQIGMAAEMVVFAIALSARIRAIQREKTVLSLRAAHLARAAMTDALTGLANRRGLADGTQRLLAQPGRHAVLLFDLDRFKPINDRHGHEVGDQVLVEIGRRLLQHSRDSDIAARLGGDEFVVVLGHCPGRPALDAMVQRLCDAVAAPMQIDGLSHQVSASVGVALAPEQGRDLQTLLRVADQAMYAAKRQPSRIAFAEVPAVRP